MKMPTHSTSTSRWVHYSLLWMALAVVVVVSFWRHQKWTNQGLLAAVLILAVRGVALTRDAGHLERPRREDPLLSLIGAAGALTLMRAAHAVPTFAAALIGLGGGLAVRWLRGARDYHGTRSTSGHSSASPHPWCCAATGGCSRRDSSQASYGR